MEIVIEAGSRKRKITGPFRICISEKDAKSFQRCLRNKLERGHGYGWIDIADAPPAPMVNYPPENWED